MGLGSFVKGFTGGLAGEAQGRAARAAGRNITNAIKVSEPEAFLSRIETVLPKFRELAALSAIPAFQQGAAGVLAGSGLANTGLAPFIGGAGASAGEFFALQNALREAARLQELKVDANLRGALAQQPEPSSSGLFGQGLFNLGSTALSAFGSAGLLGGGGGKKLAGTLSGGSSGLPLTDSLLGPLFGGGG